MHSSRTFKNHNFGGLPWTLFRCCKKRWLNWVVDVVYPLQQQVNDDTVDGIAVTGPNLYLPKGHDILYWFRIPASGSYERGSDVQLLLLSIVMEDRGITLLIPTEANSFQEES